MRGTAGWLSAFVLAVTSNAVVEASGSLSTAGAVRLAWVDPTGAAASVYELAHTEASAVLAEAGLEVSWRRVPPSTVLEPEEIAVVILPGGSARSRGTHRVMGATQTGDDAVAAVWVYASEVRDVLGLSGRSSAPLTPRGQALLGQALGRVAAHEIVHALLPRQPHAHSGLMSADIERSALLGPRPQMDASTRAALDVLVSTALKTASGTVKQPGEAPYSKLEDIEPVIVPD